jgi:hypothetical protein
MDTGDWLLIVISAAGFGYLIGHGLGYWSGHDDGFTKGYRAHDEQ